MKKFIPQKEMALETEMDNMFQARISRKFITLTFVKLLMLIFQKM